MTTETVLAVDIGADSNGVHWIDIGAKRDGKTFLVPVIPVKHLAWGFSPANPQYGNRPRMLENVYQGDIGDSGVGIYSSVPFIPPLNLPKSYPHPWSEKDDITTFTLGADVGFEEVTFDPGSKYSSGVIDTAKAYEVLGALTVSNLQSIVAMVKTADKEGTRIFFKREGDFFVPYRFEIFHWDTNDRAWVLALAMVVAAVVAGYLAAGAAATEAGAAGAISAGEAATAGGVAATEAATAGGIAATEAATAGTAATVASSTVPAAVSASSGGFIPAIVKAGTNLFGTFSLEKFVTTAAGMYLSNQAQQKRGLPTQKPGPIGSVETLPDGSIVRINNDGSTTITRRDGSVATIAPDGRILAGHAGSVQTSFLDGIDTRAVLIGGGALLAVVLLTRR